MLGADGPWVPGAQRQKYDTADISTDEMDRSLARMAENKSPRPDMTPAEVLQALDADNKERLRLALSNWYRTNWIPMEAAQAEVVTLFNTGNPKLFQNYRPISLLDSLYKLYPKEPDKLSKPNSTDSGLDATPLNSYIVYDVF